MTKLTNESLVETPKRMFKYASSVTLKIQYQNMYQHTRVGSKSAQ